MTTLLTLLGAAGLGERRQSILVQSAGYPRAPLAAAT
jgi:hypothetical protein